MHSGRRGGRPGRGGWEEEACLEALAAAPPTAHPRPRPLPTPTVQFPCCCCSSKVVVATAPASVVIAVLHLARGEGLGVLEPSCYFLLVAAGASELWKIIAQVL